MPDLVSSVPTEPPKESWLRRNLRRFTRRQGWPSWGFFFLLLIKEIPDWKARIDFWLAAAKAAGGYTAVAATVIASPYSSLGLAAAGVLWMLFVGEPQKGVQRHHWLPYLGWAIFGICFSAVVVTAGWGAIQVYIQSQISQKTEHEYPDRSLSRAEIDNLLSALAPISHNFGYDIQVESVSASRDVAGYAQQFMAVFHLAGLIVNGVASTDNHTLLFPSTAQVSSSQLRGIYIGVSTPLSVPSRATQFQLALDNAGFDAPFIMWNGVAKNGFVFVVSYK